MKEKQNKCSAKYISYYDPPLVGLHMDYMIYMIYSILSLHWFKDIYREDIF